MDALVTSKTRHISTPSGDFEWTTYLHAISQDSNSVLGVVPKGPHTSVGPSEIVNSDLQELLPPSLRKAGLPFIAASQVVLNNLRTSFGSPGATLAKFEALLGVKEAGGYDSMSSLEEASEIGGFFWELERLVLEASRGTRGPAVCRFSLSDPMFTKEAAQMHPTIAFFRTNQEVCNKYFKKIRPKLFNALLPFSTDSEIIARGFQVLSAIPYADIDPSPVEGFFLPWSQQCTISCVESICKPIVNAMCNQCDTEGVVGLKAHVVKLIMSSPQNEENYKFDEDEVMRRLVWMDAAEVICKGDLETAARMLALALHMFANVFPGESTTPKNPLRKKWNKFYRVAIPKKGNPPKNEKSNEKKNLSEFVTGNLSCHFFSLYGVEFAAEKAIECLEALEDWGAVERMQVRRERRERKR